MQHITVLSSYCSQWLHCCFVFSDLILNQTTICSSELYRVGISFPRAAVLRQDTKTIDKDVFKMTLERLVHCITLFRAEWSCGVPGKTGLSGSCCAVDSKPQRLPPLSLHPSSLLLLCLPFICPHPSLPFQIPPPVIGLHGLLPIFPPSFRCATPNAPAWGEWLLLIPCQSNPNWATA